MSGPETHIKRDPDPAQADVETVGLRQDLMLTSCLGVKKTLQEPEEVRSGNRRTRRRREREEGVES